MGGAECLDFGEQLQVKEEHLSKTKNEDSTANAKVYKNLLLLNYTASKISDCAKQIAKM